MDRKRWDPTHVAGRSEPSGRHTHPGRPEIGKNEKTLERPEEEDEEEEGGSVEMVSRRTCCLTLRSLWDRQ